MAVLAMIIGEDEHYVLDWFFPIVPPISDEDAMVFLANHGVFFGNYADLTQLGNNGKGIKITADTEIKILYTLANRLAYITVDSPITEGLFHAVLWNGKQVLDPLNKIPQSLKNYKVREVYPLTCTSKRLKYYERIWEETTEETGGGKDE